MKKLFFISLIILSGCKVISEKSVRYNTQVINKTIAPNIVKDTTEYLINHIITNKQKYIGKPLEKLFKDIAIDIKSYTYSDTKMFTMVEGLYIKFIGRDEYEKLPDYATAKKLYIEFDSLISIKEPQRLKIKNKRQWTSEERAFYGKLIIKDIVLPGYIPSK